MSERVRQTGKTERGKLTALVVLWPRRLELCNNCWIWRSQHKACRPQPTSRLPPPRGRSAPSKVRLSPKSALHPVVIPCFGDHRARSHESYPTLLVFPTLEPNSPSRFRHPLPSTQPRGSTACHATFHSKSKNPRSFVLVASVSSNAHLVYTSHTQVAFLPWRSSRVEPQAQVPESLPLNGTEGAPLRNFALVVLQVT